MGRSNNPAFCRSAPCARMAYDVAREFRAQGALLQVTPARFFQFASCQLSGEGFLQEGLAEVGDVGKPIAVALGEPV